MQNDLSKTSGSSPTSHRNPNQVSGSSPPDKLLSPREVVSLLGIHPKTLQRWCRSGRISFVRIHGRNRFRASEIALFISEREVRAGRRAA